MARCNMILKVTKYCSNKENLFTNPENGTMNLNNTSIYSVTEWISLYILKHLSLWHLRDCKPSNPLPEKCWPKNMRIIKQYQHQIYDFDAMILCHGWTVQGSNPGGVRFSAGPDQPCGPPSLLYNGYGVFARGKVCLGRAADHSLPSSAMAMEE